MKCELIDLMGDDLRVVDSARVSFNKQSEWEIDFDNPKEDSFGIYLVNKLNDKDEKLIKYLAKHNHFTPFTHCFITMRETVPIFIARQRFKHTVGFTYNEISRRYVDDPPEFYIPTEWRARPEGGIKQGSSDKVIPNESLDIWDNRANYEFSYNNLVTLCKNWYELAIAKGVAPEQARMILPQSMYTSYYVSGSLAAWARAYKLRSEKTAQKEIQELASQWDKIIRPHFPVSWSALCD